jgi:hypothetical protein
MNARHQPAADPFTGPSVAPQPSGSTSPASRPEPETTSGTAFRNGVTRPTSVEAADKPTRAPSALAAAVADLPSPNTAQIMEDPMCRSIAGCSRWCRASRSPPLSPPSPRQQRACHRPRRQRYRPLAPSQVDVMSDTFPSNTIRDLAPLRNPHLDA